LWPSKPVDRIGLLLAHANFAILAVALNTTALCGHTLGNQVPGRVLWFPFHLQNHMANTQLPCPRYQTQQWKRIHSELRTLDPDFKQHLIEQATPQQKAFSELMERYQGNPVGIECRSESRMAWAFVCPNVQTEYSQSAWRVQYFDENGMTGHECYKSLLDAIESMVCYYPVQDVGALDRVSVTLAWAIGLRVQEVRDLLNRGVIGFAEFTNRCKDICNVQTGEEQYEVV
jgi:hypothetical protein